MTRKGSEVRVLYGPPAESAGQTARSAAGVRGRATRRWRPWLHSPPAYADRTPIRTLGHGSLAAADFARVALGAGIEVIVDVRRYPGSRRHPHFGPSMPEWLAEAGLAYRWLPALGGRRRPAATSPNTGLRNEQFRGYADHMASAEFARGLTELRDLAAERAVGSVAVMCAETVPWRCHGSLLADYLTLIERETVEHLFHDGRLTSHVPTPGARLTLTGELVYSSP